MLSGQGILANGLALSRFWQFTARDVLLHAVPLFHSHGLFVSLSCTLLSGYTLLMTLRFNADEVLRLLPRASVFMAVPCAKSSASCLQPCSTMIPTRRSGFRFMPSRLWPV